MPLSPYFKKLFLHFEDPKLEEQYLTYRKKEIQKNIRYFLMVLVYGVAGMALLIRDANSIAFVIVSTLLYQLNERYPSISLFTDCVWHI